jgi:transposase-like protein
VARTKSSSADETKSSEPAAESAVKPATKKKAAKRRGRRRATGRTAKPAAKTAAQPAKGVRRKRRGARARKRYTPAERTRILATARREGLSGRKAAERFGISEVTYYLWRKKARPAIRQAARDVRQSGVIDLAADIQKQLQERIRQLMPDAIRKEIDAVLADIRPRTRRRRKR